MAEKKQTVSHKNTNKQGVKKQGPKGQTVKAKMGSGKKQTARKADKQSFRKKVLILVGAAAVFYILASVFFSSRFFLRTEINGYSCQFKTVEQVKKMLHKGCEEFVLTLEEREEKTETITSKQVSLEFVDDGKIEAIKESQKGYAWLGAIFKKSVYENAATITFQEEELVKTVNQLEGLKKENMKAPKAAYPSYHNESGKFEIRVPVLGNRLFCV